MVENLVKYNENNWGLMIEDREKRVLPCGKDVCWKELASAAALLPQMSEINMWWFVQIYSVDAVVDLYLTVEEHSRQCSRNQIMEELKHCEQDSVVASLLQNFWHGQGY